MISDGDIPKELMGSFKRIARRIPVDLKKDEDLIKTVLAYLQLGGEKLARQAVEVARETLELELAQKRKRSREEALIRAAEARTASVDAQSDENDEDFDDNDNDDDDNDDDSDDDI
ncbi:MAG: hypothetical protein WBY88_01730 [Desulfosarcina sp.]